MCARGMEEGLGGGEGGCLPACEGEEGCRTGGEGKL